MSAGKAIYARLAAVAGVTTLVSTRIYPLRLPQGPTYPAVRYQVIGRPVTHLMGADLNETHGRVQVDCYAATYDGAQALSAAVKTALSRWEGSAGGVTVDHVFFDDARDLDEPSPLRDGESGVYRVMMDFTVFYRE